MKAIEKGKAQKLLERICGGDFDECDVDGLFLKLRPYSAGFPIFREISDFVAHAEIRDRGISNQAIATMYWRMKFFNEYNSPKKSLDLSRPFPAWIKNLMVLQVDRCKPQDIRDKFNVTSERLKKRIESGFKVDKKSKTATVNTGKLSSNTLEAIRHVMGFISGGPAFTQEMLIEELVGVSKKNHLAFEEADLRARQNQIALSVLFLIHNSEYDYKGHQKGLSEISCEKTSIPHNLVCIDESGNKVEVEESFGNLAIVGHSVVDYDGKDITILHTIMSTDLSVEEYCDESLFTIEPVSEEHSDILYKKVRFDCDLYINSNFRFACESA